MDYPRKKSFSAELLKQRQKKRPSAILVIAVIVALIAVGYALYMRFGIKDIPPTETVAPPEETQITSVAVLPLDNISGDPEQEYFTDGMHEALIADLSKISALRVIGRTSVMQFRDTEKTIPEIAKQLNVDALVEGSVFRADGTVRITVQLVRAVPEQHLWSNNYVRDIKDVIMMQQEVARTIADEIKITVTSEEQELLSSTRTINPEAYDYYLRGKEYYRRGFGKGDMQIALQMYQKAIELDPAFALAYTRISGVHRGMYWFYYDRTQERLAKAKEAVDRAIELNPDLPEAHLALGWYYYQGYLDYDRALEQFDIARKSQPNNSELLAAIGYVQRRQGKFEQALANIKKASELDPLSNILAGQLGITFMYLSNYPEAEFYYNRAISLAPDIPALYTRKAMLYIRREGNTEKARAVLDKSPLNVDSAENPYINTFITLDVYDGNYQEALNRLSLKPVDIDNMHYYIPKTLRYALIYRHMNKNDLAQAHYDSARITLENKIQEQPEDERVHSSLGIAYAGLGRKEEAISEGKLGVALLPVSKEALRGLSRITDLARIYVMVGEYDMAIDEIEFLLSRPGEMTTHILRLDPIWAPLREHPRFKALMKGE